MLDCMIWVLNYHLIILDLILQKKKKSLDLKRPIFVCFESYKFIGADI